ncbi:hypothetical protein CARUB_v10007361mg [Capsella rubella]|uniref:FKB95-like N-terminal Kelch domain-containing protein n=1 Tax=Capsella rubella TaxID=81985 RepID=R0H271_9BRAS|nr:F-box/kelch-repeat protein At5g38670 [Capsella rubella]EOA18765.1 hypothetical protein CARUB_v10007361mg [Capsella rubella]
MSSSQGKKKAYKTRQSNSNPTLSDDLILSCVARVSRLYYPTTLSFVSKSIRSFVASPEIYKERSLSSCTESCLYVCLQLHPLDEDPKWFTLYRKPNQTLTCDTSNDNKKSSGYSLATVPIPHSPPMDHSNLVAVGSNIYIVGGSVSPSSRVSILDCQSNTWREGPSLPEELFTVSVSVIGRKIFVLGICKDGFPNKFYVFDTKTLTWDPLPILGTETTHCTYKKIICFGDELHRVSKTGVVDTYSSRESRWDEVKPNKEHYHFLRDSSCKIGNVLYSVSKGEFKWYDNEVRVWRQLKGVLGLLKFHLHDACARLADYGGKMAVLWDEFMPGRKKMIWCAVIALEIRENCEIWGEVEWFDHVLTVPWKYKFIKVLAPTV